MDNKFYIDAIEGNLFKFSLFLGSNQEGCTYNGEDIKWVYTGGLSTNRIFPLKMNEYDLDEKLSKVIERFKAWKVPVNLFICSGTYPENIEGYLSEHGFAFLRRWSGMAIDINGFSKDIQSPPDIKIAEAGDAQALKVWSKTSGTAFSVPEEVLGNMQNLYTDIGLKNQDKLFYYTGFKNGVPAATTLLYKDGDIAGLYLVGTLPEARGGGIATAMVVHALKEAAFMGCSTAILQASEMGKFVYDKIGFKEYCTIDIYKAQF